MIYPKSKTSQKSSDPSQRRFLNQPQREELRKQIIERLQKKFGVKYGDVIQGEVNNFINETQNITSNGLQILEDNIKQQTSKQGKVVHQIQDDNQSEKSQKSKQSGMSGASNFDKVDQYTVKKPVKEDEEKDQTYKDKKLQTLNVKKPENDIGFLDEENEWAAIYKYNRYLYAKEQDLIKEKKKEQMIRIQEDLGKQIEEKRDIVRHKKAEEDAFTRNLQLQMQRYDDKEQSKEDAQINLRNAEKDARLRQIKENKIKKKHEDKQQKALDGYLMQKVREEIEAEKQYAQFKREHQAQVMAKLLEENEERKKTVLAKEKDDRQENIKLMDAYCKLIEDQDLSKQKATKDRDAKMKEYSKKIEETISAGQEDKIAAMEARREKYFQRNEKKLDARADAEKVKLKEQKSMIKDALFKQMDEKVERERLLKLNHNEQANIWANDNEEFADYEVQRMSSRKKVIDQYKNTLLTQISDNSKAKKVGQRMDQNEQNLNKELLKDLEGLNVE